MPDPVAIEVFSDIVCPWCFIGTARLTKILSETDLPAVVTMRPFRLQPATPDGGIDIPEMIRKKYGGDPAVMFARVAAAGRDAGLELDPAKQTRMVPTLRGHTLLRHAIAKGTQVAMARALFEAYFQEVRDISAPAVLSEIGARFGFTPDEATRVVTDPVELGITREEADRASRQGIRGVPYFVFGGRVAFSGAQPEAAFREALKRVS